MLLVQNRLANTNLVWGIPNPGYLPPANGSIVHPSVNESYVVGFPGNYNVLSIVLGSIFHPLLAVFPPSYMFLYRGGIYIILSLILCIFLASRKALKLSLPFIPMLGGIIALFFGMGWPVFRVVWFIPVIFVFIVPLILISVAALPSIEPVQELKKEE